MNLQYLSKKKAGRVFLIVMAALFGGVFPVAAWQHHPLITAPVMEALSQDMVLHPAAAVPLEDFLTAVEGSLAMFLAEEESWAREHLPWYTPCPEELDFVATGNPEDIRERFFRAIRINPNTKTPLYLAVMSGSDIPGATLLEPQEVTLFPNADALESFDFVKVLPGGLLNAMDIVATASNEPDYGMDTGLFEDNDTAFGREYGFGVQPFGNSALDYASQAPFHIGFYHESPLVFLFANFLTRTYPEYRIRLFKRLSEFAFEHGQDYWGWRFMGWGLHYVADLAMPYHTTVLPGYSTLRMLWINFLDILGISTPVDNALQLVSNRHMAIEAYQHIVIERALREGEENIILTVLEREYDAPPYTDDLPRTLLAKASNRMARRLNKAVVKYMPHDFVANPSIELGDNEHLDSIVEMIEEEHGTKALAELNALLAEALKLFALYGRSYILDILAAQ